MHYVREIYRMTYIQCTEYSIYVYVQLAYERPGKYVECFYFMSFGHLHIFI